MCFPPPWVLPGQAESVATFRGNEFFSYNLSQTPIQSSLDEITLSFRTRQRNGLLLHTGRSADYVNLSLRNGALWLVINLGSGAFEALVEPAAGNFNDNGWHDVRVTRNLRQVRRTHACLAHTHGHKRTHTCTSTHTPALCTYGRRALYAHVHACICRQKDRRAHTHTGTQPQSHTDRQTD